MNDQSRSLKLTSVHTRRYLYVDNTSVRTEVRVALDFRHPSLRSCVRGARKARTYPRFLISRDRNSSFLFFPFLSLSLPKKNN